MVFKVPEKFRKTKGKFATDASWGNNGVFLARRETTPLRIYRCVVSDKGGWEHVAVSLPGRTPSWNDMCWIKALFWGPEDCVVQYHPPEKDYINYHRNTLHLWRHKEASIIRPHVSLVGPYEPEGNND